MSCYISSNNNRFYVALESTYGTVPAITQQNRIPAVSLTAKQVLEQTSRRDKTGTRTFVGLPNQIRRLTNFGVDTFLTEWSNQSAPPSYGALFEGAMGGTPIIFTGRTVASTNGTTQIVFTAPHGLSAGQGVTFNAEMRFVAAVQDTVTIFVNAPFSTPPQSGSLFGTTITYVLAENLPSVSIFDYWDPSDAVQRILDGSAIDKMVVKVNGNYQEFDFSGPARDLIDSASFTSGEGAHRISRGTVHGGFRLHDRARTHWRSVDGRDAGTVLNDHFGRTDA